MVRRDLEARVEVEAMRVGAVGSDTRVEVKLITLESARFVDEPLEEAPSVAAAAGFRKCRQIVDVEEAAPGEHVPDTEPGYRSRMWPFGLEGAHEPVSLGALNRVD